MGNECTITVSHQVKVNAGIKPLLGWKSPSVTSSLRGLISEGGQGKYRFLNLKAELLVPRHVGATIQ